MVRTTPGVGERFITNDDVVYDIIENLLDEKGGDKFRLRNRTFGGERMMTRMEIVKLVEQGRARFHEEGRNTIEISKSGIRGARVPDFSMLNEEEKNQAKERYEAIKPILAKQNPSKKDITLRVEELKSMDKPGSIASIYRWVKAYKQSSEDIRSLLSNYEGCGSVGKQFSNKVEEILENVIQEHYLKRENESIEGLWYLIKGKINRENKQRIKNELVPLKCPSKSTVRRRVIEVDIFQAAKEKHGIHHAFNKYGKVNLKKKAEYPLERVEADHTQLDLFVVDEENGLPIGRPYFTLILDCATGYPLGFYMGFENPSYTSVMYALKHAISTKSYVKELYPEIENEWLAYGLPQQLIVDNGKEFRSNSLKDVCLQMGIKLEHAPPRNPWCKAQVERYFRTINQQLLHSKPGTSFSNILKRGDYDPKKNAVISLKLLLKIFHKWLLDFYVIAPRKGVDGKPQELWRNGTRGLVQPQILSFKPDWEIILGAKGSGTIQRSGVRHNHLFYLLPPNEDLQNKLVQKYENTNIEFKINPDDVSKIHVYDEFNNKYIEALCTDQEYSKGLKSYTHRSIVKATREKFNDVDNDKLAETKVEIQDWVDNAWVSIKTRDRSKAARHKDIGSNQILKGGNPEKEISKKEEKQVAPKVSKSKKAKETKGEERKKVVNVAPPIFDDDDDDFSSDISGF
ncbi:transposase [Virgibacillus sp. DJP39]|uniref:transposase n=1 Tax=Virgibacillus sp. DJP39 TaxID=3409790 RepID=UPI003BB71024